MAEGSFFGFERPFVEEEEKSLIVIYEFTNALTIEDIRRAAQSITARIENSLDTVISNLNAETSRSLSYVSVTLGVTNLNATKIDDLRDIARGLDGYKNMIVSSEPPENIVRL